MRRAILCTVLAFLVAGCDRSPPVIPPVKAPIKKPAKPIANKPRPKQPSKEEIAARQQKIAARQKAEEERAALARQVIERRESTERLLLLTPGGPLIVDIVVLIDGEPLRMDRSKRIDDLMKALAPESKSDPTWATAAASADFTVGPFKERPDDDELLERMIRASDLDRDDVVDRDEVAALIAREERAEPDFMLDLTAMGASGDSYDSAVWKLLDAEGDGLLSPAELTEAEARLKLQDTDDDDLLYPDEITGEAAMQPGMTPPRSDEPPTVVSLGHDANWSTIRYLLREKYTWDAEDGELLPVVALLAGQLDADKNGRVESEEFAGLRSVTPHVELEARFGSADDLPQGVFTQSLAPELSADDSRRSDIPGGIALLLTGVKLRFFSNDPAPPDYAEVAKAQIMALDADSNGYLEEKEFPEAAEGAGQAFADIDGDKDGKVFPAEIVAYAEKQQAPLLRRVRATTAGQDDALFAALDASSDGRLTMRELRQAPDRLIGLDRDADGAISAGEIPASIGIAFARGGQNAGQPVAVPRPAMPAPAVAAAGPKWFARMDSNGDGDLSPREFLGDKERFKSLDTSGDGFVDAAEAAATDAG